jgi:MoaA/NifB/PqqE/SkfB family radical SAM enzyme
VLARLLRQVQKRAYLLYRYRNVSICYVDVIDACHLRCATCVRGRRLLPNDVRHRMTMETFSQIVDKAKREGYPAIGLYNWSEPFLNPEIDRYVALVRRAGLFCDISTTLSFRNREALIERTIRAGLATMIVSVSGARQSTHEINHRGGNLEIVHANLEWIGRLIRDSGINTRVELRFLTFGYNGVETAEAAEQAQRFGVDFLAVPATGDPFNPDHNGDRPADITRRLNDFNGSRPYDSEGHICPLIMDTIAIDVRGRVLQCCATPIYDSLAIGDYLAEDQDALLRKRYTHPICATCSFPRRPLTEAEEVALNRVTNG